MTTFLPQLDAEQPRLGTAGGASPGWYGRLMVSASIQAHGEQPVLISVPTNLELGGSMSKHHDLQAARRAAAKAAARGLAEPPVDRVVGLQKWHAMVVGVSEDLVELELESSDGGPNLLADFPLELFAEDEPMPGDLAYVTVRTVKGWRGQPSRTVSARLRRVGRWTQEELDQIRAVAAVESKEMNALFD